MPSKRSSLEKKFLLFWQGVDGQPLKAEHTFDESGRKWRFDFAHVESKVAIELEGGIWGNGAHNRGAGYEKDCEKYNEAKFQGWDVFRLTGDMICVKTLERIKRFIDFVPTHSPYNDKP